MSKPILTCLSIDCAERKSVCCGAPSVAVTGHEGTGHFECAKCHGEFVGGKCNADKFDDFLDEPQEPETMSHYKPMNTKGKTETWVNEYSKLWKTDGQSYGRILAFISKLYSTVYQQGRAEGEEFYKQHHPIHFNRKEWSEFLKKHNVKL